MLADCGRKPEGDMLSPHRNGENMETPHNISRSRGVARGPPPPAEV